jgi:hypothetical protein
LTHCHDAEAFVEQALCDRSLLSSFDSVRLDD